MKFKKLKNTEKYKIEILEGKISSIQVKHTVKSIGKRLETGELERSEDSAIYINKKTKSCDCNLQEL